MDKMKIKRTGRVLRIALLLRTGRGKLSQLRINPLSITTGIGWFIQRVFEVVNFQFTHFTGLNSNFSACSNNDSNCLNQRLSVIFPISSHISPALALNQPAEKKACLSLQVTYKPEPATRYFLFLLPAGY